MHSIPNGRSLAQVVADIKEEFKDFVQTRVQLFKTETQQKLELLKVAAVLAGVALVTAAWADLVTGVCAVLAVSAGAATRLSCLIARQLSAPTPRRMIGNSIVCRMAVT